MKNLRYFFLSIMIFVFYGAFAQEDYRGENKVFFKFELVNGDYLVYESEKLTLDINEEQNLFVLAVDMSTFNPLGEHVKKDLWDDIFQGDKGDELSYRGDFYIMKIDAQTDRKQQIEINGILHLGDHALDKPLVIEWFQMDRFVFVDFEYKVSLAGLDIMVPEKYKQELTGIIALEVLNAKLMAGFR